MTQEEKTTKQKILEVSNDLFAKNGFSETSVREIAAKAGVNIAAINYHFKSKETLYWTVFEFNYETIKEGVRKSGERTTTTVELAIEVYKFFISSESAMLNMFKIFLSDSLGPPPEEEFGGGHHKGPPGEDIFLQKIKSDLGEGYPAESYRWVIKMIFSLLVHFGVVMNTSLMKKKCKEDEDLLPGNLERFIGHSVQAHLDYIKKKPKLD